MRRSVMTLVLKSFTGWLTDHLPPSGKPLVFDLEAECLGIINFVPTGTGPEFVDANVLTEESIKQIYEWMFSSLAASMTAHRGWGLAAHSLQLHALEHLPELLKRLQAPTKLSNHNEAKLPSESSSGTSGKGCSS